ncbi:MAG TPA: hypothetical protein VK982_09025 [Bacteroidales bacterium]|nr:hypothetical protein [Bacteroidales bacterium]
MSDDIKGYINIGDNEDEVNKTLSEFPNLDGMHNIDIPSDWDGEPLPQISSNEFKREKTDNSGSDTEKVSLPYKEDEIILKITPEELVILRNVLIRSVIDYKQDKYFKSSNISKVDEIMTYKKMSDSLKECLCNYYEKKGYDPLLAYWKDRAINEHEV